MVVGLFAHANYRNQRVTLAGGDSIVLFTDGVTEAENDAEDQIGIEPVATGEQIAGLTQTRLLPVIKFREHCITCFSCEIFCPEHIVDVHPSVKNRPRPW